MRPANLLRLLAFLAVATLLLYAGLRTQPLPEVFPGEDKWQHALGLCAFAIALRVAMPRLRLAWFAAACVAMAAGIELAQAWLPLRTPSLADVAAGLAGAALGWALVEMLWRMRGSG